VIRAAIFDLDGTLVESLPGIAEALNQALASVGHAGHPEATVRGFIGNGSLVLARRGLPAGSPEALVEAVEAAFLERYAETCRDGTTPFPGIDELVGALVSRGLPLAVFSNKPHGFTAKIVAHLFPSNPFQAALGHRDGAPHKPDPAGALVMASDMGIPPAEIAFVGDSTIDFDTARNAGMAPILVDWGYHTHEALAATGAPIVSSPADLLPLLAAPPRGA
jgi:phosphoglycolate phosphatase